MVRQIHAFKGEALSIIGDRKHRVETIPCHDDINSPCLRMLDCIPNGLSSDLEEQQLRQRASADVFHSQLDLGRCISAHVCYEKGEGGSHSARVYGASTQRGNQSPHLCSSVIRCVEKLGKILIKIEQAPPIDVLLQDFTHQVNLEECWQNFVVKIGCESLPLFTFLALNSVAGRLKQFRSASNLGLRYS